METKAQQAAREENNKTKQTRQKKTEVKNIKKKK